MSKAPLSVYIGFDPREVDGFAVTRESIRKNTIAPLPVFGLILDQLRSEGLYTRSNHLNTLPDGRKVMWDDISGAPMATEFAISRFLVPYLATKGFTKVGGLSIFMDSDMMVRADLVRFLETFDRSKAVWCVKHNHQAVEGTKMDGQVQTAYARKNWSSVIVFNTDHPSNRKLTLDLVNSVPGRDLHRFCWLDDNEIGELTPHWNYLVGVNEPIAHPKIVHFTEGIPSMKGYEDQPFADEWRGYLYDWASR